jgi:hypothetical protein
LDIVVRRPISAVFLLVIPAKAGIQLHSRAIAGTRPDQKDKELDSGFRRNDEQKKTGRPT